MLGFSKVPVFLCHPVHEVQGQAVDVENDIICSDIFRKFIMEALFSDSGLIPHFTYFHAIKIRLFIKKYKLFHAFLCFKGKHNQMRITSIAVRIYYLLWWRASKVERCKHQLNPLPRRGHKRIDALTRMTSRICECGSSECSVLWTAEATHKCDVTLCEKKSDLSEIIILTT